MTTLISEQHLAQNKLMHKELNFGVSGYKWAPSVGWIIHHHQIKQLLDYGAGQQTLKFALKDQFEVNIVSYDPAVPELSIPPKTTELLTCTDVLEHIELENIENVLDHIQSIATKFVFLVIPTGPAAKKLPDGRNAHLIQRSLHWWLPKLMSRFDLISLNNASGDIVFFGSRKSDCTSTVHHELVKLINELSENQLVSVTFDGMYWNVSLKPSRLSERILPRVISFFKLGAKIGLTEKRRAPTTIPRVSITRF
jgi:hypothetical protein